MAVTGTPENVKMPGDGTNVRQSVDVWLLRQPQAPSFLPPPPPSLALTLREVLCLDRLDL